MLKVGHMIEAFPIAEFVDLEPGKRQWGQFFIVDKPYKNMLNP